MKFNDKIKIQSDNAIRLALRHVNQKNENARKALYLVKTATMYSGMLDYQEAYNRALASLKISVGENHIDYKLAAL
jgi:hypothetical protein